MNHQWLNNLGLVAWFLEIKKTDFFLGTAHTQKCKLVGEGCEPCLHELNFNGKSCKSNANRLLLNWMT